MTFKAENQGFANGFYVRNIWALDDKKDDATVLSAIHACIQAGAVYMKIIDSADLEERIKKLEEIHDIKKAG